MIFKLEAVRGSLEARRKERRWVFKYCSGLIHAGQPAFASRKFSLAEWPVADNAL